MPSKKYELEKSIETKIRKALHAAGVLCFKNNVDNRQLHTGLGIGCSDLLCVVPPYGRWLSIEVKSYRPGSKTTPEQEKHLFLVRQFGGVSGVARCVADAMNLVQEARSAI